MNNNGHNQLVNGNSQNNKDVDQALIKEKQKFIETHSKTVAWMNKRGITFQDLIKNSAAILTAAAMLSGSMIKPPKVEGFFDWGSAEAKETDKDKNILITSQQEHDDVLSHLNELTHNTIGHLKRDDEVYAEAQLTELLGFSVFAEYKQHRLNHSIGIMGGEQHLMRYPGDILTNHDAYLESGIAPGRGAFGWFTQDGELTDQAKMREKYYFAVQTLYLPDWNTNYRALKPWYKFRKMVVVNPAEEVAVVGVVGDAGPALWVKKQFGGSPEVIMEGKIWSPKSRGKVMLFFVDDPEDKIPLGPYDLSYRADE